MLADSQNNKVYFSCLSSYDFVREIDELINIFKQISVEYKFIVYTRDYFCQDYMPVQISQSEFVQFVFDPPYLKKDEESKKWITDVKKVHRENKWLQQFKIYQSDIKLDGSSIVKSKNKVIVSDFIFNQNKQENKSSIIKKLKDIFKVDIILIPTCPYEEETGHVNNTIRFIDENTILTVPLKNEPEKYLEWIDEFKKVIRENNLRHVELPYTEGEENTSWAYINYLRVKDNIILPIFDNEYTDTKMVEFFKNNFEKTKIHTLNLSLLKDQYDAVLDSFTWSILQ